jgi:D-alanine-D-alanine ligase
MSGWRVGLLYDLKHSIHPDADAPTDALAEYDSLETVQGIEDALIAGQNEVIPMEGDHTLLDALRASKPDICFNICEGRRGDARESQVPALLEFLGIPYTGSKILGHALSLDKAMAKRVWRDCGLPTPSFQVFHRDAEALASELEFPLFVKPVGEGSGMGVSGASIVHDSAALREQVRHIIRTYRQPALVEAFLPGREFTVGLLGNSPYSGLLPASDLYADCGFHVLPVLEIDVSPIAEAGGLYTSHIKVDLPLGPKYLCPAPIDRELARELRRLAVEAFQAIGALDVARVDFRLDEQEQPQLLEINTLPGLNPTYSDIVIAARAEGMHYTDLINEILRLAAARYCLRAAKRHSTSRAGGDRVHRLAQPSR